MLFIRAVVAFLLLPGVVAGLVPWLLHPAGVPLRPFGLVAVVPGLTALVWCARDFYVAGGGTLAPWSPPRHLVEVGLYRYSRNPMYLSVTLILLGWTLAFRTTTLAAYAALVVILFYVRVVTVEEPWCRATFGDEWVRYRARVRRWL